MQSNKRLSPFEKRLHLISGAAFAIFFYLCFHKLAEPTMSLTQHRISGGLTAYNTVISALVLTALLIGLQHFIQRHIPIRGRSYILSYSPSAAVAIAITAFVPQIHTAALVVSGLLLLVWLLAVRDSRRPNYKMPKRGDSGSIRRHLFNFLMLVLLIGLFAHPSDTLSYEMRTSRCLNEGKFEQALEVGEQSLATSPRLVALRTYAMSQLPGGAGDRLFSMPLPQKANARMLLLTERDSSNTLFRPDTLFNRLGCHPKKKESAIKYLERCAKKQPHGMARDYYLCALLLEKDVERFAEVLPQYYTIADSIALPRYYAEALVLFNRLHPQAECKYKSPNVTANYIDFKEKGKKESSAQARKNLLRREYGNTYWWYYFYGNSDD